MNLEFKVLKLKTEKEKRIYRSLLKHMGYNKEEINTLVPHTNGRKRNISSSDLVELPDLCYM